MNIQSSETKQPVYLPGNHAPKPPPVWRRTFAMIRTSLPLLGLLATGCAVGFFAASDSAFIAVIIALAILPLMFLWVWRSVLQPLRSIAKSIQEHTRESTSLGALSISELHNWFGQILNQLNRLDEQNLFLRSQLLERTRKLQDQNDRLRLISEELGQSYASIDDEMKVLGVLQKNLLPEDTINLGHITIRSFYLPNGRAGGDYYDIIGNKNDETFILMADVSGHGSPAAFIMGITRAIIHTEIMHQNSPSAILNSVNQFLFKNLRSGEFVTMFLARVDATSQFMTYSNAGHIPPTLMNHDHTRLNPLEEARWLPLGVMNESRYEEHTVSICHRDRLLLYTDGFIESQNEAKEVYGQERVDRILKDNGKESAEHCLDTLIMDLEHFANRPIDLEPLDDDVTLMLIEFLPIPSSVHLSEQTA